MRQVLRFVPFRARTANGIAMRQVLRFVPGENHKWLEVVAPAGHCKSVLL